MNKYEYKKYIKLKRKIYKTTQQSFYKETDCLSQQKRR